ncbi:MAG: IS1634 family transposase [Deltaproteobacteria bacterium]|jgi:transposase|nr:IS1634 family transposase [Deltaproteobacteria bacterium]
MASLVSKIINGNKYFYAVESARVDGKPRIVKQTYLGTLEKIVEANQRVKADGIDTPSNSEVLEFGAVSALMDVSERLGIRGIIDEVVGKRNQGLPVGDSLVIAAINRAVAPVSRKFFREKWFEKTVLPGCFPLANAQNLSSQAFWNSMSLVTSDHIRLIEDEIASRIIKYYNISTECLYFGNTNFITYFDSDNPSKIVKTGKSKEHGADLRIVGLSLMVSEDFNIPLFYETYPINMKDVEYLTEIIDRLKARCSKLLFNPDLTLVFDKGNNSSSNFEKLLEIDPFAFHFIGGLKLNQCKQLHNIPINKYVVLQGEQFRDSKAYRTTIEKYGQIFTAVITDNPELYKSQMRSIAILISKCNSEFDDLITKIGLKQQGKICECFKCSVDSINSKVTTILSREHMKEIFDYIISEEHNHISLTYKLNYDKLKYLQNSILGKTVLFTSRNNWTNEKIVSAYRSQHHVAATFKQMKDDKYVSLYQLRHYTDNKIIVHNFYCGLALTLLSVLNLEFFRVGHCLSMDSMLANLSESRQVINYYVKNKKIIKTYSLTKMPHVAKNYIDEYKLYKYSCNKRNVDKIK